MPNQDDQVNLYTDRLSKARMEQSGRARCECEMRKVNKQIVACVRATGQVLLSAGRCKSWYRSVKNTLMWWMPVENARAYADSGWWGREKGLCRMGRKCAGDRIGNGTAVMLLD